MASLDKRIKDLTLLETSENADNIVVDDVSEPDFTKTKRQTKQNFLKEVVNTFDNYYTKSQIDDFNFLIEELDPVFTAWLDTNPFDDYYTKTQIDDFGFLTEETDPIWTSEKTNYYTKTESDERYLQSFTETDPIFTAWLDTSPLDDYFLRDQTTPQEVLGTPEFEDLKLTDRILGTPTVQTLNDVFDHTRSGGYTTGAQVTTHTPQDGQIDITGGTAFIRKVDSDTAQLFCIDFPAKNNLELIDNSVNYIYAKWDTGTESIVIGTTGVLNDINGNDVICIRICYRRGNIVEKFDDIKNSGVYLPNWRYNDWHRLEHRGVERYSGGRISEVSTRNLYATASLLYRGFAESVTPSIDTSATDRFTYVYRDGSGGWTYDNNSGAGYQQVSNILYDDGDGTPGNVDIAKYAVYWVYLCLQGELYIQMGQSGTLNLLQAQQRQPPTPPDYLTKWAYLLGKIIVLRGSTNFTEIQNTLDISFTSTSASDHNELSGLQGGTLGEYFHLTQAEYSLVQNIPTTYVPYTGANSNVDLGNYTFRAKQAGIGTAVEAIPLTIGNIGNLNMRFRHTDVPTYRFDLGLNQDGQAGFYNYNDGDGQFKSLYFIGNPVFFNHVGGGNVGIGNSNPQYTLDVTGVGNFSTSIRTPKIANLTTNGFVKTSGSDGTLSVDTTSYQPLDADLTAIGNLSSTGIATRTAGNTWAQRTITGTTNKIDVSDGNGVSGNPTITISSTYTGQTSITTVGTIGNGTWNGTTINANKGGTGQYEYTAGDLLYATATTTLSKLGIGSTGKVLTVSSGGLPVWDSPQLPVSGNEQIPFFNDEGVLSVNDYFNFYENEYGGYLRIGEDDYNAQIGKDVYGSAFIQLSDYYPFFSVNSEQVNLYDYITTYPTIEFRHSSYDDDRIKVYDNSQNEVFRFHQNDGLYLSDAYGTRIRLALTGGDDELIETFDTNGDDAFKVHTSDGIRFSRSGVERFKFAPDDDDTLVVYDDNSNTIFELNKNEGVKSPTQGFQLPDYNDVGNPTEGRIAYDYTNHYPVHYNGSTWTQI